MKKLILFALILSLVFSSVPAFANDAVTVELDGTVIDCKDANGNKVDPLLINGTTYLPVRAIAAALDLTIDWDDSTKTVFINGVSVLAKKTDVINIFINGSKFIAKDANGNVVNPILENGTTYLPVRAIGEAFDKEVTWIAETKTVKLTTVAPKIDTTVIDFNKTYAIVNKSTGKALTATDRYTVVSEDFAKKAEQGFKFSATPNDGFYFIQSVFNGQNFDVSGHSVEAGGEIITWDATGAENQMFTVKDVEGGALIYAFTSGLPIEPTAVNTIQNRKTESDTQKWELVEFDAPVVAKPQNTGAYSVFTVGNLVLTNTPEALRMENANNSSSQKWSLVDAGNGEYVITNVATNMSLDVSGQSYNAGDPIITWYTSSDPNQRWILEKNADDTYLIKSVHSGLYLTNLNGALIQTYKDSSLLQCWTMTATN